MRAKAGIHLRLRCKGEATWIPPVEYGHQLHGAGKTEGAVDFQSTLWKSFGFELGVV